LAFAAAAPGGAQAQTATLLSGYGAPGQGNQVILGATLLGGPGGGSAGSGGSGGANGLAVAASGSAGLVAAGHGAAGTAAGIVRSASSGEASRAGGAGRSGAAPGGSTPTSYPAAEPASATSPALGLSGTDVLYIALAAAVLGLTVVLTRRMVRAGPPQGRS
jgi:hypothetical protein